MRLAPARTLASLTLGLITAGCAAATPSSSPPDDVISLDVAPGAFTRATRDDVAVFRELGSDTKIGSLYRGEKAFIVDVSVTDGGAPWARVQMGGTFGWIALDPDDPMLEPVEPECPEGPTDRVVEIAEVMAITQAERLHCFGGRTLRLSPVTSRELSNDTPYGGTPDWLADEPVLNLHGRGGFMSDDGPVLAHIAPESGVRLEEGTWYAIELRVDDPAARTCRRDLILEEMGVAEPARVEEELAPVIAEDAVLWCRQQFVVTSATPIAPPPPIAEPHNPLAEGSWRRIPEAPLLGRSETGAVWTGEELIVWGGRATDNGVASDGRVVDFFSANDGAAYDPSTNAWRPLAESPLGGRSSPAFAWTGEEVLVLGGFDDEFEPLTDAAAYNPTTDSWRSIPNPPAAALPIGTSVWMDDRLLVVAADGTSAATYAPRDDAWKDLPRPPLPDDLYVIGSTWTGDEAIVVAYPNGITVTAVAVAWDPQASAWRELAPSPIVALNAYPGPIWTGAELIVFSRSLHETQPDGVPPDSVYGSFYDPTRDSWRIGAVQEAFVSPGQMTVIGDLAVGSEAAYDIGADAWLEMPGRPEGAWGPPVSTGDEVLFWGGSPGGDVLFRFNDGIAFRPDR